MNTNAAASPGLQRKLQDIFIMFETENHLEQFESTGKRIIRNKLINWIIAISILVNTIGIFGVYLSLVPVVGAKEIFFELLFYFQLLFSRGIPVIALLYFLSKQKFGWTLMVIVAVFEVLQKIALPIILLHGSIKLSQIGAMRLSLLLVTSILSAVMLWLLLTQKVRTLLEITKKRQFVSITIGIALFLLIQFIVSPLLVNLAKSRGG